MASTIHFSLLNNQMTDVTVNAWDDRTGLQVASNVPINIDESFGIDIAADSDATGSSHWVFASSDGSVNSNKQQSDIHDGDVCMLG
ncbi:hypothetical protein [Paraburkholderia sp. BR13444]|uniref:hypothetical protein n=1 Tax=Paraburkholderia sp. BR13444 TaxID=3236997 RepID=UPI0034CE1582